MVCSKDYDVEKEEEENIFTYWAKMAGREEIQRCCGEAAEVRL